MTFIYIVRCRFTAPEREQAWNDWYSGPKIEQMLSKPYFLTCQRFRRAAGDGRDYVALWTMETPEALQTPEYLSQWGFSEWTPLITDWSRDLFDARPAPASAFGVTPAGALKVISFDGMTEEAARNASAELAGSDPGIMWLPVVGLNRHTPIIGLQTLPTQTGSPGPGRDRVQQGIYRPISALYSAPQRAA